MTQFSIHDRNLALKITNGFGEYIGTETIQIKAHTGFPAGATDLDLPPYDKDEERCYLIEGRWVVTKFWVGRPVYLTFGEEVHIPCFPWEDKPEVFTLVQPPEAEEGFVPKLVNGEWEYVEDLAGKMAFSKDRNGDDFVLEPHQELLDTHTLLPYEDYSEWDEVAGTWLFSDALYRPTFVMLETEWQAACWKKVISALDNHRFDCELGNTSPELRTCTLSDAEYIELLTDRKGLHDYLEAADFPECGRPKLSTVIKY